MSVLDEVGILLGTSTESSKFGCFLKCNSNPACKMTSFKSNQCKLLSQVKFSVQLSPTSQPCLFQKFVPDYSAINADLVHWWPFNNDVKDIVDGADLYDGSTTGKSFTTDRLNQPSSALYLQNANYKMPARKYFVGDYTVTFWVKQHTFGSYDTVMQTGLSKYSGNPYYFSVVLEIATSLAYPWMCHGLRGNYVSLVSSVTLRLNKWQHVAFTLSGTIGKVYIDGQLVKQGTTNVPEDVLRDYNSFGSGNGERFCAGAEFDDFKIFNRSLTQSEIRKVLNSYY